jgi:Ca2+-binding RTX toxin-like protein
MTITTVSTSTGLVSALKVAHAGDTIQLAAGNYAASLENFHFATDVTITSLDPAHAAVMTSLFVKGVNGLTFQGLDFTVSGATSNNAAIVESSQDVHFNDVYVHGTLNNDPSTDGGGILLRGSSDVSVTNSTFEQLYWGVAHVNSSNVTVSNSDFHDLRMDGVRGGGSSNVTIAGNRFHDFSPNAGDHGDAIQFWTSGTTTAAHDILVENNVFQRGAGDVAQGVFIRDESGALPFQHVVVRGNLISGGMYNGIAVFGAKDVTIDDNIVQGFSDAKSWIQVSRADGVVLTNNDSNQVILTDTVTHSSNTGSVVIAQATDFGAAVFAQWTAEHGGGAGTPAPAPAPAPGGSGPVGLNLVGTSAADTLTGGALADTLSGGAGHDLLIGGAGDDVYVSGSDTKIMELAGGGIDTVQRSGNYALGANVENLQLIGTSAGSGIGNNLDNEITGNGAGNALSGGAGADTLSGGGGGDTLNGGVGADRLIGGAGADVFTFGAGDGKDVITDFGAGGEHDAIDVSARLGGSQGATLSDATSGLTISFSGGDSIFLQGVHLNQLHATSTGWVF